MLSPFRIGFIFYYNLHGPTITLRCGLPRYASPSGWFLSVLDVDGIPKVKNEYCRVILSAVRFLPRNVTLVNAFSQREKSIQSCHPI